MSDHSHRCCWSHMCTREIELNPQHKRLIIPIMPLCCVSSLNPSTTFGGELISWNRSDYWQMWIWSSKEEDGIIAMDGRKYKQNKDVTEVPLVWPRIYLLFRCREKKLKSLKCLRYSLTVRFGCGLSLFIAPTTCNINSLDHMKDRP